MWSEPTFRIPRLNREHKFLFTGKKRIFLLSVSRKVITSQISITGSISIAEMISKKSSRFLRRAHIGRIRAIEIPVAYNIRRIKAFVKTNAPFVSPRAIYKLIEWATSQLLSWNAMFQMVKEEIGHPYVFVCWNGFLYKRHSTSFPLWLDWKSTAVNSYDETTLPVPCD